MTRQIFTIGYSNHSTDDLLALLRMNEITAIADVRSQPHSRFNPDFSRASIQKILAKAGIEYAFLGLELGARSPDRSCYVNGKVIYSRLANSENFKMGLTRIKTGATKYRIAMLCAEKEPLDCHRCILVSRYLVQQECNVSHILGNGACESHCQSTARLISRLGLDAPDMFRTHEETLNLAYELQENKIAYEQQTTPVPALIA